MYFVMFQRHYYLVSNRLDQFEVISKLTSNLLKAVFEMNVMSFKALQLHVSDHYDMKLNIHY